MSKLMEKLATLKYRDLNDEYREKIRQREAAEMAAGIATDAMISDDDPNKFSKGVLANMAVTEGMRHANGETALRQRLDRHARDAGLRNLDFVESKRRSKIDTLAKIESLRDVDVTGSTVKGGLWGAGIGGVIGLGAGLAHRGGSASTLLAGAAGAGVLGGLGALANGVSAKSTNNRYDRLRADPDRHVDLVRRSRELWRSDVE